MKDLITANLDKFLIIFVFLCGAAMWILRPTPFTEGVVRDIVIAIVAYLTGKHINGGQNGVS